MRLPTADWRLKPEEFFALPAIWLLLRQLSDLLFITYCLLLQVEKYHLLNRLLAYLAEGICLVAFHAAVEGGTENSLR